MIHRKKSAQRLLSWMLVLMLMLGMFPVLPAAAEDTAPEELAETTETTDPTEVTEPEPTEPVKLTLEELMEKFPEGKYWNGGDPDSWTDTPCTHHGSCGKYGWNGWCGCNSFNGQSIQCMGFAEKLGFDATGYSPRENANGWKTVYSSSAINTLKAGDIVRRNGHSMYVTAVDGDTVTVADCNAINKSCNIRWGVTKTKSDLKYNNFEYVRVAPEELAIGYLGKCEDYLSSGTVTVNADTVLRTHPCSQEAYEDSLEVATVGSPTVLTATGVCKNTEDQLWYEVTWEDQRAYLPAEAVSEFVPDFGTVTVTDVSAPANTRKGSGFPIKGTVSSDTLPLTQVGAYIYAGSQTGDTPYMTSEDTASNKHTYTIYGSAVDSNLTFGKLALGEYTYLLTASVTNHYVAEDEIVSDVRAIRLHQNTFTVSSSLSCTHSYTQEQTADASCGEDGIITYTCKKCAFAYTQTVFATGEHIMGQWETVKKPTCTEEGCAEMACEGCELTYSKTLPVSDEHGGEVPVRIAPTCTEKGCTALYCADCGELICYEDYEDALGHSYEDPIVLREATLAEPGQLQQTCSLCSFVETQEIPCLAGEVEGWSLTLRGDLNVNFRLRIDDNICQTAQVVITVDENTFRYPVGKSYRDAAGDSYKFTVPVAAAQMGDTICVQVVNGEEAGPVMEYSVVEYAQEILRDDALSDCHGLVRQMLRYGGAAQTYFNHNPENPVDADIAEEETQIVPQSWQQPVAVNGAVEGIRFYGATLLYREKIAVRYYFTVFGNIEDYVFRSGDAIYTPVQKDGLWYVEMPDILIQDLDESLSLTVNDSLQVVYSPMNYIVRMNQKGSEQTKALMQALYSYYLAAEAYVEAQ